ncbi:MAG: rhodanese-like domain-containing protein [Alphaproteobacteria bacterium]|nr:rhodanese-like domain-containing protein [Alphaproteobacteria bacterium]
MIRLLSIILVLLFGTSSMVRGGETVVAAPQASLETQAGTRTLIDVRHVTEWRQTGVPAGAKEITIHDRAGIAGFVAKVTKVVRGNKAAPVSVICGRGVRSSRAAEALARAGFTNIRNVREGMHGNSQDGPGWITRSLPVQPCKNC